MFFLWNNPISDQRFHYSSCTNYLITEIVYVIPCLERFSIDHFTVVCLVTWPLDGSEARVDLVLIQTSLLLLCKTSCSDFNKVHLHDKSREVCIKTRSTLASLPSTGQVAEQTTVKWSIDRFHCHAIKKLIENYPVDKVKKL